MTAVEDDQMTPVQHAQIAADALRRAFQNAAFFRKSCAVEGPEDARNFEAVAIFETLTSTIGGCSMPDLRTWGDLNCYDETTRATEVMNDLLESVGFSYWPESASAFVQDFIKRNVH